MKALITGATGFIGSHLAEQLHGKGYEIRALVRTSSNTKWLDHLPIEYVTGSLDDAESLKDAVAGVDVVYHVAGLVAARNTEEFFKGNEGATRNMLEAVEQYNPNIERFVHVSSLAAIGPALSEDRPVSETTEPHPITTYGRSKLAAEKVVREFGSKIPSTIVRPPAVYGPRDVGVYSFFQVVAKGFAPLIGFGRKVVSLVHVEDLTGGIILAGETKRAIGEDYFISSEGFYTWEEVGEIAAAALGKKKARYMRIPHGVVYASAGLSGLFGRFRAKPPILDLEKGRDITQPFWICSVDKAVEHLGYRQKVSVGEGVVGTAQWYREQGWL